TGTTRVRAICRLSASRRASRHPQTAISTSGMASSQKYWGSPNDRLTKSIFGSTVVSPSASSSLHLAPARRALFTLVEPHGGNRLEVDRLGSYRRSARMPVYRRPLREIGARHFGLRG